MYANKNNEVFPTDTVGITSPSMTPLNLLYPDYVSNKKMFNCPRDKDSSTNTFSITEGVAFCPWHNEVMVMTGTITSLQQNLALQSRLTAHHHTPLTNKTDNSPNHDDEGQNVVYADGHVEHITTPTAGCTFSDGPRDHIYLDTTLTSTTGTGGTDSVILHNG